MKSSYSVIIFSLLFATISCFSTLSDEEREKERKLDEMMKYYSENGEHDAKDIAKAKELFKSVLEKDSHSTGQDIENDIDYSKLDISKDSIDLELFRLITSSTKNSDAALFKNIEILINKGANPNARLTISGSERKTGTYIPIVKHFYKNKYRNYTYITTAFHAAVASGKIELVEKMISLGAKVNIPAEPDNFPINVAVANSDSKMIFFLLDNGANINHVDLSNLKDVDLIENLVKVGADPKNIDINFALDNKKELNRLLVLKPDMSNLELNFAKLFNDDELLDLLLDHGLSLKTKGTFPNNCPLIFGAVRYGNQNALKKLIDLGADKSANCKSGFGETPLLRAIHYGQADIVEYLLSIGVSPNEKEWTKKSALSNAAETDNDRIINLLIDAGAKIEYNAYFGTTPLMTAVDRKKYIAVQTLLDRGANVNYKDKYGLTPLVIAIKENDYPIIKLLVERGAKINIKYDGKTLVEFAKEREASPMIIDYLKTVK